MPNRVHRVPTQDAQNDVKDINIVDAIYQSFVLNRGSCKSPYFSGFSGSGGTPHLGVVQSTSWVPTQDAQNDVNDINIVDAIYGSFVLNRVSCN
jgi:hypothetical protein